MEKHDRKNFLGNFLFGAVAGLAGTWLMDKATTLMYTYESEETKKREAELMKEPAYTVLARRIAEKAGIALSEDEGAKAGNAFHWSYGVTWGALYGALHDKVPLLSRAAGLPYGMAVFAAGDEGFNTAMRLAPPPRKFPLAVHLRGLVGHAVYAVTLDTVYRLLKEAVVARPARTPSAEHRGDLRSSFRPGSAVHGQG